MNQQFLISQLINFPESPKTREIYIEISNLYKDQFGLDWTLKEIHQARNEVQDAARRKFGGNNLRAVRYLIETYSDPQTVEALARRRSYVGLKEISASDFAVYCKGLFWLAGYDLANNF